MKEPQQIYERRRHAFASGLDLFGQALIFQSINSARTPWGRETLAQTLICCIGQKISQCAAYQKFAVIDERVVWYGSINLLSFGSAEESNQYEPIQMRGDQVYVIEVAVGILKREDGVERSGK